MDFVVMLLQPFLTRLLHMTWQAGTLVCLILLVQKVLGRQIGVRGRYCLWFLLLVRMGAPWAPQSPVSVHNLLPLPELGGYEWAALSESSTVGSAPALPDGTSARWERDIAGRPADDAPTAGAAMTLSTRWRHWLERHVTVSLLLLWLAGACTLSGHIVAGHVRLRRIVRRARPVTDRRILDLLIDCQRQMGVSGALGVVTTDGIDSPALFGFIRPRLLLPGTAMAELSLCELRHIFLHELAHLKRHDILVGHVVSVLHVLHWFNPLVAIGLRRMRADRELACDGLALSVLRPDETDAYGHTVVRQIERLLASRSCRMLARLSGDKTRITERIAMISRFRRRTYRWSPTAVVLVGCLACAGLTDGRAVHQSSEASPEGPAIVRYDGHENIVRIHVQHRNTGKYLVVDGERVACDANEPGEAGLWEARFNGDLGHGDNPVYFYSVAASKYLTWDEQGNVAVNGLYPDKSARWRGWARPDGDWISTRGFARLHLRPDEHGGVSAAHGSDPSNGWYIHQIWRVRTSSKAVSNPRWRIEHVLGPEDFSDVTFGQPGGLPRETLLAEL